MSDSNNKYRRLISFLVLIAIIVLSGAMFYQVMASFVLPLFLAAVLCVVFAPLHRWILRKYKARVRLAALTTTTIIGLVVLLPLITTVSIAIVEGSRLTSTVPPAVSRTVLPTCGDDLILTSLTRRRWYKLNLR